MGLPLLSAVQLPVRYRAYAWSDIYEAFSSLNSTKSFFSDSSIFSTISFWFNSFF
jgi:hypothetical protein